MVFVVDAVVFLLLLSLFDVVVYVLIVLVTCVFIYVQLHVSKMLSFANMFGEISKS